MSNIHSLQAEDRNVMGTGSARAIRRRSMVPATIYGAGKAQVMLALPLKELTLEYRKQGFLSHMFDIQVGKDKYRVLPKAIQLHPVTDQIEHMDFIHIDKNTKVKANVSIHFINEAKCPGVKQGGVLTIARHNLEIYSLPDSIPESIEIDVINLNVGQSIHVSDVVLPKGVETKLDPAITIAAIVVGKVEGESAEEETTPAA